MAKANVEIVGAKEVIKAMWDFEKNTRRKLMRKALREGVKVLQSAEKSAAPVGKTHVLLKQIKVRAQKKSRVSIGIYLVIGAKVEDKKPFPMWESYYSPFVEYGSKTKSGKVKIPAEHFTLKVWNSTKNNALDVVLSKAFELIEEEINAARRANHAG